MMYGDMPNEDEGFEGPEKTLNVVFTADAGTVARSMRDVPRERWSQTLELARCQILSVMNGQCCDSYVLSESSLFVYARRVILKTCGTTRLLLALDDIVALGAERGLRLRYVEFARKNFTFPARQLYPHTSFADERAFLDERFGTCCPGGPVVAGPLSDDHWYFYVADLSRPGDEETADEALDGSSRVFEVRMHELDRAAAQGFYNFPGMTGRGVTEASGIGALIPGMTIDEHLFEPCGYSMNGILGPWYATIHVTPEEHCSYASFETNLPLAAYDGLLAAVLGVFRPSTWTAHVLSSRGVPAGELAAPSGFIHANSTCETPLAAGLSVRTWSFVSQVEDARRPRRLARSNAAECLEAPKAVLAQAATPTPEVFAVSPSLEDSCGSTPVNECVAPSPMIVTQPVSSHFPSVCLAFSS